MKDNPYSKMIEMMQKQGATSNPPSIQIGEVISPSPKLVIRVNDLQIDKTNLLIADYLLSDYERKVVVNAEKLKFSQYSARGFGSVTPEGLHSHSVGDLTTSEAGLHAHSLISIDIETPARLEATKGTSYIRTTDTLKKGDLVAALPVENRQLYIILARLMEVS